MFVLPVVIALPSYMLKVPSYACTTAASGRRLNDFLEINDCMEIIVLYLLWYEFNTG
jgi:hypothetical protein